jgi:CelD/BcsL family acetyltransferase involved in cellulose biosynthesis
VAASVSAHRRGEYARLTRRLAERGRVSIETAIDPAAVCQRFDEFVSLEASGWKGRAGTALASEPARLAFARRAVAAHGEAGAVRIHALCLDGRTLASLISFVSAGTAFTWKIAYDEAEAKSSPGGQLMLAAVAAMLGEPGVHRVDSCAAPNHPLAEALLPERMTIGTFVISPVGEGRRYRAGLAAASLATVLTDGARRVRDRLRRGG